MADPADWASTKDSRQCNLACLCRLHHLFKHLEQVGLIQFGAGGLGFKTALGQYVTTWPETYLDELQLAHLDSG